MQYLRRGQRLSASLQFVLLVSGLQPFTVLCYRLHVEGLHVNALGLSAAERLRRLYFLLAKHRADALHWPGVMADRNLRGHRAVTSSIFRCGSRQFTAKRCRSLPHLRQTAGDGALASTMTHSTAMWCNAATTQFLPCQGWGRGFESLRPLQFPSPSKPRSSAVFVFSERLKSQPPECAFGARVTSGLQVRQSGVA